MEGHSLDNYCPYLNYDNNTTCSSETIMEDMGNVKGTTWLPIITMKENLINHMKDDFNNDIKLDEEEEKYLDGTSNLIIQFMERFKKQQTKMDESEVRMNKVIQENQKDIEILTTFIDFLSKINEKCDQDISPIQSDILKISNKMMSSNDMKKTRDTYILEKKKFHKYLNIIGLLNQMNVGSTCSICLQDNVDSYFNPCGHTACSTCCKKNSDYNDNNCPLCRKDIRSVHKLYFT